LCGINYDKRKSKNNESDNNNIEDISIHRSINPKRLNTKCNPLLIKSSSNNENNNLSSPHFLQSSPAKNNISLPNLQYRRMYDILKILTSLQFITSENNISVTSISYKKKYEKDREISACDKISYFNPHHFPFLPEPYFSFFPSFTFPFSFSKDGLHSSPKKKINPLKIPPSLDLIPPFYLLDTSYKSNSKNPYYLFCNCSQYLSFEHKLNLISVVTSILGNMNNRKKTLEDGEISCVKKQNNKKTPIFSQFPPFFSNFIDMDDITPILSYFTLYILLSLFRLEQLKAFSSIFIKFYLNY
jgi:hypothetical protein